MKQRILVLAVAICASVLLIVPVWPRFVSGAITAQHEDTLRDIARDRKVSRARLQETETALRVARKWTDDGKLSQSLGNMRFIAARNADSASAQRAALTETISVLREGLAKAPAQPYAWLQLAQADRARNGPAASIEQYLSMSMILARWEHRLVLPRREIALAAWPRLSPAFKSRLPGQFERAIDTAPLALARATRRSFALRAVRQMLAASPIHLERFGVVYFSPD